MNKKLFSGIILSGVTLTFVRLYQYRKVERLFKYIGTNYNWGGCSPGGFDCSGLVYWYYFNYLGKKIPRVSKDQFNRATKINKIFARPGDLIFFDTYLSGQVNHVGIYIGNNKFIHSGTSSNVSIQDINTPYWSKRLVDFGRI